MRTGGSYERGNPVGMDRDHVSDGFSIGNAKQSVQIIDSTLKPNIQEKANVSLEKRFFLVFGTSHLRKCNLLGPYRRLMPRVTGES